MAKKINREEIKVEVKRRQQNAARDYAEKACSLGDEISCDDAVNLLIKIQKVEAR